MYVWDKVRAQSNNDMGYQIFSLMATYFFQLFGLDKCW